MAVTTIEIDTVLSGPAHTAAIGRPARCRRQSLKGKKIKEGMRMP